MRLAGTRLHQHPSRKGLTRDTKAGPVWTGEVRMNEEWLDQPLRWKRPRMIFVCAHSDLFHESVPDAWIDQVFAVMAAAHWHTFQVLTKRAERMRSYLTGKGGAVPWLRGAISDAAFAMRGVGAAFAAKDAPWPLPNVWLGASAEDQRRADERIPHLLATPAAVRWVSAEPLLGPITLSGEQADRGWNWLTGDAFEVDATPPASRWAGNTGRRIDWVIAGGESGPGARPMHPAWARSLRDQCAAVGVPFHFKQWGNFHPHGQALADGSINCLGNPDAPERWHSWGDGESAWAIGKSRAGRLLDGCEHNDFPNPKESLA